MTNVFFIWSRARSEKISLALRDLLRDAVQGPNYYHSEDIPGGSLWRYALQETITESDFGVVCLTPENRTARWPHFEAGLIAQAGGEEKIVPYLYDLEPADVEAPLGDLQPRRATRDDTLRLAYQIGNLRPNHDPEAIERIFEEYAWERFRGRLDDLPEPEDPADQAGEVVEPRRTESKIDELLERVRRLDKSADKNAAMSAALEAADAFAKSSGHSGSKPSELNESVSRWYWYLDEDNRDGLAIEAPVGSTVVDRGEEGLLIASPIQIPDRRALSADEVLEEFKRRNLSSADINTVVPSV